MQGVGMTLTNDRGSLDEKSEESPGTKTGSVTRHKTKLPSCHLSTLRPELIVEGPSTKKISKVTSERDLCAVESNATIQTLANRPVTEQLPLEKMASQASKEPQSRT